MPPLASGVKMSREKSCWHSSLKPLLGCWAPGDNREFGVLRVKPPVTGSSSHKCFKRHLWCVHQGSQRAPLTAPGIKGDRIKELAKTFKFFYIFHPETKKKIPFFLPWDKTIRHMSVENSPSKLYFPHNSSNVCLVTFGRECLMLSHGQVLISNPLQIVIFY